MSAENNQYPSLNENGIKQKEGIATRFGAQNGLIWQQLEQKKCINFLTPYNAKINAALDDR